MLRSARTGLVPTMTLVAVAVMTGGFALLAPAASAQEPPECHLEKAVYLNPENWVCLGTPCPGGYCCLICEQNPGG